jgi:hypothetical protein
LINEYDLVAVVVEPVVRGGNSERSGELSTLSTGYGYSELFPVTNIPEAGLYQRLMILRPKRVGKVRGMESQGS